MRNYLHIIFEVLTIGLLTTFFTFCIYYLMRNQLQESKKAQYIKMFIGSFLVGALLHLSFEFSGINEKWCRYIYKIV